MAELRPQDPDATYLCMKCTSDLTVLVRETRDRQVLLLRGRSPATWTVLVTCGECDTEQTFHGPWAKE